MKREIKFRFWDEELKTYTYDYHLIDREGCLHDEYGGRESGDSVIVEQCTGLKDKNGREIYEGDIVRDVEVEDDIAVIEWGLEKDNDVRAGYYANWQNPEYEKWVITVNDGKAFEVIGNIHENPELLEESK